MRHSNSKLSPVTPAYSQSFIDTSPSADILNSLNVIYNAEFGELINYKADKDQSLLSWMCNLLNTLSSLMRHEGSPVAALLELLNRSEWWICLRFWSAIFTEKIFREVQFHFRNSNRTSVFTKLHQPDIPSDLTSYFLSLLHFYCTSLSFSKRASDAIYSTNLISHIETFISPPTSYLFDFVEFSGSFLIPKCTFQTDTSPINNFHLLQLASMKLFSFFYDSNTMDLTPNEVVSSLIRMHYFQFLRHYYSLAPVLGETPDQSNLSCVFATAHANCLLALASNTLQISSSATTFFQLRVVPFLASEMKREYEETLSNEKRSDSNFAVVGFENRKGGDRRVSCFAGIYIKQIFDIFIHRK